MALQDPSEEARAFIEFNQTPKKKESTKLYEEDKEESKKHGSHQKAGT